MESSRSKSRPLRAILSICIAAAVATTILSSGRTATTGQDALVGRSAPHVTVAALPGVDLRRVTEHPGVTAASGPFSTVTTGARHGNRESDLTLESRPSRTTVVARPLLATGAWARAGSIVLGEAAARALGVRSGDRITVSAVHGPASLRVAGIARATRSHTSLGYVTPRTLGRLVPNERTYGSTLYVRIADPGNSKQYADWVRHSYPAQQITVEERHRLEASTGVSPSLAWIGALAVVLCAAALLIRLRRPRHGSPGTRVASHA
jgi:ABC-type lipoprotein release transport system permease subunit